MKGLNLAIDYVNYKPRTKKEVERHLIKKDVDEKEIENIISTLEETYLLNDIDYVKEYTRFGLEKRRGIFRIKQELRERGIKEYDIEDGLYQLEREEDIEFQSIELENAKIERDRIVKNYGNTLKIKEKVMRRLNYLGYGSHIIFKTVGELSWERDGKFL